MCVELQMYIVIKTNRTIGISKKKQSHKHTDTYTFTNTYTSTDTRTHTLKNTHTKRHTHTWKFEQGLQTVTHLLWPVGPVLLRNTTVMKLPVFWKYLLFTSTRVFSIYLDECSCLFFMKRRHCSLCAVQLTVLFIAAYETTSH